ncbi:ABC transporter permease [bacterium]|nr:ABC transporter permease [bacterium]
MLKFCREVLEITKKDLKELLRDRIRLISFLLMPIFMMTIIGYIYPSQNTVQGIPLAVADQDNSEISQEVVNQIKELHNPDSQQPVFELIFKQNKEEVKDAIKKGDANGGLIILDGFEDKIKKGSSATIVIVEDEANPIVSQIVSQLLDKFLSQLSLGFAQQRVKLLIENVNKQFNELPQHSSIAHFGTKSFFAVPDLKPIKVSFEGIVGEESNYFEFMAPGVMAMVILTAVLTGLASSISREEETGTIDGIMVAPVSRFSIIVGKSFTQALRGIVQGLIILALSMLLFGVKVYGSFWLVLFLMFLGIFSFVGLGILVSAFATRQETATQLLFMFQLPMILLSGVFFPIQQMPKIMQYISKGIPFTYMVNALRQVLVLGASLGDVKVDIFVLAGFGLLTLFIAVPVFRWIMTR